MNKLINRIEIPVRFSENDPMGVVWHGNYIKYFEDGREAFGLQYNISYMDYFNNSILAPIVKIYCDYKRSLRFGDTAVIETEYEYSESAKLIFNYKIFDKKSELLCASGRTIQVFTDIKGNLILTHPEFFEKWKVTWGFPGSHYND